METRVARLEEDMRDVKAIGARLEGGLADVKQSVAGLQQTVTTLQQSVTRIEATLAATLPHLATKAELAEKPGKTYLVSLLAVLITAYGAGLAALAILK
jgi:predicted  nucleic acid-binding Zn-ribbon protein